MSRDAQSRVDKAIGDGWISRRGAVKVHRLAWTICDLRGQGSPGIDEAEIALALRRGDPLPSAAVAERVG